MATQTTAKLRLVRCPGCGEVLAERPDFSLYRCGGCGLTLQAKNWKLASMHTELSSQEIHSIVNGQDGNILEEMEPKCLDHDLTGPHSVQSSPDEDSTSGRVLNEECNMVVSEERSVVSSSVGVGCPQNKPLKLGSPMDQNCEGYNGKFDELSKSSSGESASSGECTHEAEAIRFDYVEQNSKNYLHEDVNKEGCQSGRMWQEGDGFVDEVRCLPAFEDQESVLPSDGKRRDGNKRNFVLPKVDGKGQIFSSDQDVAYSCGGMKVTELNLFSGSVPLANGDVSRPIEQCAELDGEANGFDTYRNSSTETHRNADDCGSMVANQRCLNESLASNYLVCAEDEQSPVEDGHTFGKVGSVDTLGRSAHSDLIPELKLKRESMTNHPTDSRSYNGRVDQIRKHIPLKKGNDVRTIEMLRFRANTMKSEPERAFCRTNSLHCAMRSSHWGPDATEGYTSENNLSRNTGGFVSRLHPSREPLLSSRTKGPSSLLPPRPRSDKGAYSEADKMDMLRTVYELKDQLNRMHFSKVTRSTRFPNKVVGRRFNPSNCDDFRPERRTFANPDYPSTCNLQCDEAKVCSQGSAAHYIHHGSCWCSRLPMHSRHCTGHNHYYMSSELKSEEARQGRIKRWCFKEKCDRAKRVVRAVAGAAPFITCYRCSALLQLPADFLIFKKRWHELRCNACRKVLKFSVLKGSCIIRYGLSPPPSDSVSHSGSGVESYYGLTFSKNSSSKGVLETIGSIGPSSSKWRKSSSGNSRLHHLMGYSSPSQVLK